MAILTSFHCTQQDIQPIAERVHCCGTAEHDVAPDTGLFDSHMIACMQLLLMRMWCQGFVMR